MAVRRRADQYLTPVSANLRAGKSLRGGLDRRLKMMREKDPMSNAHAETMTREFLKSIDAAGVAFAFVQLGLKKALMTAPWISRACR
jgi:hypothetical protein